VYTEGKPGKLPDLIAELIRLKMDVIVTQSGVASAGREAPRRARYRS
jgi:hypothetical protein